MVETLPRRKLAFELTVVTSIISSAYVIGCGFTRSRTESIRKSGLGLSLAIGGRESLPTAHGPFLTEEAVEAIKATLPAGLVGFEHKPVPPRDDVDPLIRDSAYPALVCVWARRLWDGARFKRG